LLIERLGQDGLDGVVAVLAHGVGAGARGLQARGAKPLSEAEHALGAAQAIEGPLAEQRLDEGGTGGADLGGALPAPDRGLQKKLQFLGGQVGRDRLPLPGPLGVVATSRWSWKTRFVACRAPQPLP
jgi:hypothetical protein